MSLIIESKKIDLSPSFQEYVEELLDGDDLSSVDKSALTEYLFESESNIFWDCLSELYPEGELISKISYETAVKTFTSKTRENIEANREDFDIFLKTFDNSNKFIDSLVISGADILLEFLENESSCGEFDAKVSEYVEKSLELFVDNSYWHCGYIKKDGTIVELASQTNYSVDINDKKPILWFGPIGEKPEDIWAIKYDEPLAEAWFYVDQWSLIEYLIDDFNNSFGIWYLAECNRWLPDMEEILKTCPIKFELTDTIEAINQKFDQFFK